LQWDLNYLIKLWTAIEGAGKGGKGAFLIYQESSLVIRAIRDYFNSDIGDILFDTDDVYEQAKQFMAHVMPEHEHRVKRYRDDAPLFSRFQIEHQIESAYARTVQLPSGGAIVIDQTEALVSVDVNSARAIKGGDIEETATRTNLEAADEVARQMRLRDLGGLVVIDFIDMEESRNRRDVENRLRDALRQDRARVQFGTISKFGLMEMSRQRLRPTLSEGASVPCPRCGGSGHIRDTESSALQILRIIQEESLKDSTASVLCQVPVDVASFLLNEKRSEISKIEMKQRINVLLVPNKTLETPNYKLERLKHDDPRLDNIEASYKMAEEMEDPTTVTRRSQEKHNKQEPVIKGVLPDAPAPLAPQKPVLAPAAAPPVQQRAPVPAAAPAEKGFFGWIKGLFGAAEVPAARAAASDLKKDQPNAEARQAGRGERGDGRGEGRGDGRNERGGRDGRRAGRGGRSESRQEGRPGAEARPEVRPDGRSGERRERSPEPHVEPRSDQRLESQEQREPRPPREPREPREGGRSDRPRRERGERAERGERPPRDTTEQDIAIANQAAMAAAGGSSAANEQDRPDAGGRPQRGERNGRRNERGGERRDAGTAPPAEQDTSLDATSAPASQPDGSPQNDEQRQPREPRERRSRDRYGRERRERGEANEGQGRDPNAAEAPGFTENASSNEVLDHTMRAPAAPETAATETLASAVVPAAIPAPIQVVHVTAAPAKEAVALAPVSSDLPKVASYDLPLHDLVQVAQGSGLQWVNSDSAKIAAVQAAIALEAKPVHIPRQRPPVVAPNAASLVLVETKRDLRETQMPFEKS
jgi:ribonuclease E